MAVPKKEHRLLTCGEHGEQRPWYVVCVHVLNGERPAAHLVAPSEEDPVGEAVCEECSNHKPDLDLLRPICDKCTEGTILPRANQSRN